MSNFLDRDFFFDCEVPSSTPPDFATQPQMTKKFGTLLTKKRSLVSDLVDIPNRRIFQIERDTERKAEYQLLWSYFMTTASMRQKFNGTFIWDAFSIGRIPLIKEDLQSLEVIEWTHSKLSNIAVFYFLPREEKRELLNSVKIRYREEIEALGKTIVEHLGCYNAIHLRLGDFLDNYIGYENSLVPEKFSKYLTANFPDREIPIVIATDGLHEKEFFDNAFRGYTFLFLDELIFDDYRDQYEALEFSDFNVLTILNQLVCGAANAFIGTYRSTFTSIIHRIRQERLKDRRFSFFPDDRIAILLNDELCLAPDRAGFFDWNRYSLLAKDHRDIAALREWDYDLTSIDL